MDMVYAKRLGLLLVLLAPSLASGQAWLPDARTLSVSLVHSDSESNEHFLPNGDQIDVGHTRVFSDALSAAYSPADRWLVSISVPYVRAGYHGTHPPWVCCQETSARTLQFGFRKYPSSISALLRSCFTPANFSTNA